MASQPSITRRTVLRAGAAAVAGGAVAGGSSSTAAAASPYGGWLDNTSNFGGTVDRTGRETVTVQVGVEGNAGPNGFGPAAVHVDPGTTVVWEWTGSGSHNVKAEDGGFESRITGEEGFTFEHTFGESGVYRYYCTPHRAMGMKGVVAVGDVDTGGASGSESEQSSAGPDYGDWFENVGNFEETVDRTGADTVTVDVGVEGNNGTNAFGPAAVRVDPGTTVVWEWTGSGAHNVKAEDGGFESQITGEAGFTFQHTFEETGIHRYVCTPHRAMGMKGAVVVGDDGGDAAGGDSGQFVGALGVTAGLFGLIGLGARGSDDR
jgi:halocyanin-like protein